MVTLPVMSLGSMPGVCPWNQGPSPPSGLDRATAPKPPAERRKKSRRDKPECLDFNISVFLPNLSNAVMIFQAAKAYSLLMAVHLLLLIIKGTDRANHD